MDTSFREQELQRLQGLFGVAQLQRQASSHDTPLLILHKQTLTDRYHNLSKAMPEVRPHFAIKSCPIPEVLATLKEIRASLDVATNGEIALLKQIDYPPELLIHTHPHKRPEDVKLAYNYGIRTFVVDNISELNVLKPYKNDVKILFRLSFPNNNAAIDLSYKFGLEPREALGAVKTFLNEGFNVVGASFHVGSQTENAQPYKEALQKTATFFATVKSTLDHEFSVLDIGGGFPAPYVTEVAGIDQYSSVINSLIDKHFKGVTVLSEPGRYLINPAVTLLTRVISKSRRGPKDWLFLDDGVYGSFSDMISGHMAYILYGLSELDGAKANKQYVVAGPTCDSIDVIADNAVLPELEAGDLLVVPNIGAYSYALTTEFNSIPRPRVLIL